MRPTDPRGGQSAIVVSAEGERHCTSAAVFMGAGAGLNRRSLGYTI